MTVAEDVLDGQLQLPFGEDEPPRLPWRASHVTPLDPGIAALLLPVPGTSETFAARVFHYIDASGDCWEWSGATNDGYGVIGRGGRGAGNMQAHRAVWSLLVGEISDDLQYDHLCRNHGCVNPDHGQPVPACVNKERGFSPPVLYGKRETCEFGHPLDGRLGGRGGKVKHRYCKTCAREKERSKYVPKPPRTTCGAGAHEWIPENIYVNPKTGTGTCKLCKAERQRAARAAALGPAPSRMSATSGRGLMSTAITTEDSISAGRKPATTKEGTSMASDFEYEKLLTPAECAAMWKVDPKTITRWAKAGRLTSIRTLGGHRRYRESEVRALLNPTAPPDPLAASLTSLWPAVRSGPAAAVQRRLEAAGFGTVGKLKALSAPDLEDLGFSPAQVDEVRLALANAGLALHGEVLGKVA